MHQDQVTRSQILRCLNELEKSHAATQLENRKQWRHLYNIDKPLEVSEDEGETVDNERFGGYEGSSVASQDAIVNSEILRQLRDLKSTNSALRQNQTETMRQLLSLESTNANLQSEVKSLRYQINGVERRVPYEGHVDHCIKMHAVKKDRKASERVVTILQGVLYGVCLVAVSSLFWYVVFRYLR